MRRNLTTFDARMSALRPDIKIRQLAVGHRLEGPQPITKETALIGTEGTNEWLRSLKDFGQYLDKVKALPELEVTGWPSKVVKVALLDSGVDLLAPSIRGRIHSDTNYFEGDTTHGTQMAAAILNVCPQIELHFFRVDVYEGSHGGPLVRLESVAQAIKDAADRDFDVMCIPWAVPDEHHSSSINAIRDVENHRWIFSRVDIAILYPCPSSEEGSRETPPGVSIATAGKSWPWKRDARHGFRFPVDAKITTQGNDTNFISGNAVATAMATGLAATIFRCYYLVKSYKRTKTQATGFSENRGSGFIERAFSAISRGQREEAQLMPIWDIFKLPAEIDLQAGELDLTNNMSFLSDVLQKLGG
ncbi:hypothetical protein B0J18DRAFT_296915 [Chaetomium sp. MPI-SDFR-AT-0129]|nr:hypothetical protein B0J18DRAFT_296915 [Chaetomium sp. MPI-SDFR-AT-0129]